MEENFAPIPLMFCAGNLGRICEKVKVGISGVYSLCMYHALNDDVNLLFVHKFKG